MKTLTNISVLLFIVQLCIILHKTYSFTLADRNAYDESVTDLQMNGEGESIENLDSQQFHPFFGKRRVDSAEKYFDWADKTNRPMEYLRGKRFWLFTKKDEHGNHHHHHETMPDTQTSSYPPGQGIWRSGIVGRRRRR